MPGRPFEKGQSGNPGGRLKGIERIFREEIDKLAADGNGVGVIARRLLEIGLKGEHKDSIAALKLFCERAYGLSPQHVKFEGADRPVDLSVVPADERRALLAAIDKLELLTSSADATEH